VLRAACGGLAAAEWASAPPRVGSLLLGLSRPGRSLRAALGAVARVGGEWRTAAGGRVERWLEVDLPLRPGYSGTLLVDAAGRGLGLAAGGLARGSALALPPETLRRVVEALLAHGAVRRGYLGVVTFPVRLPPPAERAAGQATALLVTGVESGSPADRAGLLLGDAILAVEGRPVAHASDLLPFLEPERVGGTLRARLWRAGAATELSLPVGARGEARSSP
jgi:S1-C subfamily serine protease